MAASTIAIKRDTFRDLENIKRCFKNACEKRGIRYNEDVVSETLIKCIKTLNLRTVEEFERSKKYIWKALFKNTFREMKYQWNSKAIALTEELEEEFIDDEYDKSIDDLYSEVVTEIKKEFGDATLEAFVNHVEKSMTYKEIVELMGGDTKYWHLAFKNVRSYIRKKFKTLVVWKCLP